MCQIASIKSDAPLRENHHRETLLYRMFRQKIDFFPKKAPMDILNLKRGAQLFYIFLRVLDFLSANCDFSS